jgi:diguanylate cyclase (GGDEF)-like protein
MAADRDGHPEADAQIDTLTGVANRVAVLLEAGRALDRAGRQQRVVAMLTVDLDRFASLVASAGETTADHVLKVVADRLTKVCRSHDRVGRLEGNRFAVLVDLVRDEQDAIVVASRILAALREPLNIGGQELRTDASVRPPVMTSSRPVQADAMPYRASRGPTARSRQESAFGS